MPAVTRAISVDEAAARLGRPATFVRQLLRSGALRGFKVPGIRATTGSKARWSIEESEIEAFIGRRKAASAPAVREVERWIPPAARENEFA